MAETKEIDNETAVDPEIVAEETPKRVVAADEGIEGLKKQLESEKIRREAAERQAQEANSVAHLAKTERDDTNLQLVSNAIETMKSRRESFLTAYDDALSKGDYKRAAALQLEMADNAVKLSQLETGRQAMSERPKTPPPAADPVEALASQLTPRSAAWLRAHPEYATDSRLYRKMVRAHEDAIDDGLKADSDEYFSAVEGRLGLNRPVADEPEEDGTEQAARVVSRRSSPAAAPVSRSAPSSAGNTRVIRLNAEEREMARLNKMTDQEYWEQKQRISRDTRYN